MDEDGEQRVLAKRLCGRTEEVDRLSNLPDCLLFQILLNLPTKAVVKYSRLSRRWRNLWRLVPGLELRYRDFQGFKAFVSFVDRFLGFNRKSCIQKFKLNFDCEKDDPNKPDISHFTRWINTVVERKVQHLHVEIAWFKRRNEIQVPPTIYTCNSLVSLRLCGGVFAHPKFVYLPSVKVMDLAMVLFANDSAFEMLISGSPVLESLTLRSPVRDNVQVLRVFSQSLLRFIYVSLGIGREVAIDAPRLEYLSLSYHENASFIINNSVSLVKLKIDIRFDNPIRPEFGPNDLHKINMIRKSLGGISSVKHMVVSLSALEIFYDYSRCEPLPLFCNLSFLDVDFLVCKGEMLPMFLEKCPNLKSLVVRNIEYEDEGNSVLQRPQCVLSSLEFVTIVKPVIWNDAMEMKLLSYFLENATILKKLTLCLHDSRKEEESDIHKRLLTIPRLSTSCQVVVCWTS